MAAFAVDLGDITSTSAPVSWAIGYVRNPSVLYTTPDGDQEMRAPYFVTRHSSIDQAVRSRPPRDKPFLLSNAIHIQTHFPQIDAFANDYAAALARAQALDEQILNAANQISSEYADLVCLVARSVFASFDITVPSDSQVGTDVKIFVKDIGTSRCVFYLDLRL